MPPVGRVDIVMVNNGQVLQFSARQTFHKRRKPFKRHFVCKCLCCDIHENFVGTMTRGFDDLKSGTDNGTYMPDIIGE